MMRKNVEQECRVRIGGKQNGWRCVRVEGGD